MKKSHSNVAIATGTNTNSRSEFLTFCAFVFAGGIISVWLGKDMNWDLLNYHFYNGWALIHRPWGTDLFPAQLQTFFNPMLDAVFYVVQRHLPDGITVFLLGAPIGAAAYALWRILPLLTTNVGDDVQALLVRMTAVILAYTGAAAVIQAGTTTNEWPVLVLVLAGIWVLLRAYRLNQRAAGSFFVAGLLLGAAVALKLTAAIQVVSISLALPWILRYRHGVVKNFACYLAGGIVAFALLDGLWMWSLYKNFHNPLFPFFNSIFKSPLLDRGSMIDIRFLPKSFFDALTFPLVNAIYKNNLHNEGLMRDPRFLIGLIIALKWIVSASIKLARGDACDDELRLRLFLAITFVSMYVLWASLFGIYRYAMLLEVLAIGMAYVSVTSRIARGRFSDAFVLAAVTLCGTVLLTEPAKFQRGEMTNKSYFSSTLPALPKNALVVTLTSQPLSYLIPQFKNHPSFVAPLSNLTSPGVNRELQRMIASAVVTHRGPIFIIMNAAGLNWAGRFLLEQYQLALNMDTCQHVEVDSDSPLLCATVSKPFVNTSGFIAADPARNQTLFGAHLPADADAAWTGDAVFISFAKKASISGKDLLINGELPIDLYRKKSSAFSKGELTIWVNGKQVRSETVDSTAESQAFKARLSAKEIEAASNGFPVISVEIRSPAAVVPAEIGAGPDQRQLGMRISLISFQ